MKAMVLTGAGEAEFRDIEKPEPGPGETLVRVTSTGICGTDLKIYQGGIPVDYPRVMGHESVGVVEAGGPLASGTRVIVDPAYSCGACYNCRDNQEHLCPNGGLIGRDINGGFADYMVAPSSNVYELPDDVGDDIAPLIQPMTTCLHAQRKCNIKPGEAVIVMGLGVTGMMHVQLAKAHGAYPVIGITRSQWKLDMALELGADFTIAPGEDTKEKVLELTNGRGADLVIESVGQLPVLGQAIDLARIGGRILPFGIYTQREANLPFYDLYFKELNVINARVAKAEDFPACVDFVQRGVVDLAPIISNTIKFENMDEALELLDSGGGRTMKIILNHSDSKAA